MAVWAGALPGAEIECFHAAAVQTEERIAATGFPELDDPGLIALLADPFTFPLRPFLTGLNEAHERVPLAGDRRRRPPARRAGAHPARRDARGGRRRRRRLGPAGPHRRLAGLPADRTRGRDHPLRGQRRPRARRRAGTRAPARRDRALSSRERALAARGLLAGLVIDENRPEYDTGDFLMRGLLGADEATGALALGDTVRVGQTLRFFVRDAASADADLRQALAGVSRRARPAGALLFTCNGRGTNMFPEPDHDARVVAEALGNQALAGFFCGGEIGPVGGKAFLHGFTATLAVFLEP